MCKFRFWVPDAPARSGKAVDIVVFNLRSFPGRRPGIQKRRWPEVRWALARRNDGWWAAAHPTRLFHGERPDIAIHHELSRAHQRRLIIRDERLTGGLAAKEVLEEPHQKQPDHPAGIAFHIRDSCGGLLRHGPSIDPPPRAWDKFWFLFRTPASRHAPLSRWVSLRAVFVGR